MYKIFFMMALSVLFCSSCKKETEELQPGSVEDYFPLTEGKYIVYDLDSILFTDFGQAQKTFSYEVKDEVDVGFTDNAGREAYRIVRYIRQQETEPWKAHQTFMAVPTVNSLEYVENNMRYIKLSLPVRNGFSWKGNAYLDTHTPEQDLSYLNNWNYTYDSVGLPFAVGDQRFMNTIKVLERDEFLGQDPSIPGTPYAEKNFSMARYAKDIGLVYREFMHWEYQGAKPGRPAYYTGYGIVQSIKEHN